MDDKPAIGMIVVAVAAAMFGLGWLSNNAETPEPVVKEVTVKVPVAQTPSSCAVALSAAEDVMRLSARALGISQKAVEAAADLNVDGVLAKAKALDALSPDLRKPVRVYERASKHCQANAVSS